MMGRKSYYYPYENKTTAIRAALDLAADAMNVAAMSCDRPKEAADYRDKYYVFQRLLESSIMKDRI